MEVTEEDMNAILTDQAIHNNENSSKLWHWLALKFGTKRRIETRVYGYDAYQFFGKLYY